MEKIANVGFIEEYKNRKLYVKGIEIPHGRIALVFNVILQNIEKSKKYPPKTDFISFGKL